MTSRAAWPRHPRAVDCQQNSDTTHLRSCWTKQLYATRSLAVPSWCGFGWRAETPAHCTHPLLIQHACPFHRPRLHFSPVRRHKEGEQREGGERKVECDGHGGWTRLAMAGTSGTLWYVHRVQHSRKLSGKWPRNRRQQAGPDGEADRGVDACACTPPPPLRAGRLNPRPPPPPPPPRLPARRGGGAAVGLAGELPSGKPAAPVFPQQAHRR